MEIELKFLLSLEHIEAFKNILNGETLNADYKGKRQLINTYFDTTEKALREFDIGLRTRISVDQNGEQKQEQTVKLAGQDVGGLHQRPEYTVPLADDVTSKFADLNRFDKSIWPEGFDVEFIQSNLRQTFETNFEREIWVVSMPGGTSVECVLDRGHVAAEGRAEDICEIELELISGQVHEVFQLAQLLTQALPLKLGVLSKAARGYRLVNNTELKCSNLEISQLSPHIELETAFIKMLSSAIGFIQHNELVLSQTESPKALRRIIDGISLVIHILQLFSPHISSERCQKFIVGFKDLRKSFAWVDVFYQLQQLQNRKSPYRKDIEKSEFLRELLAEQRFPESQMIQAKERFSTSSYNQLMLNFIQWISLKQWRNEMSLDDLSSLQQPLFHVSGEWLNDAWGNLKTQLKRHQNSSDSKTLDKLYWPLATELLTGLCVGSLYVADEWQSFRNPLVDLLVGCEELMLLNTLGQLVVEQTDDKSELEAHLAWLNGKQKSLNIALTASINNTLKLRPYW